MKDLGKLMYFLGLEVAQSRKGIYVHQKKYTLNLSKKMGIAGARNDDSPMEVNLKL